MHSSACAALQPVRRDAGRTVARDGARRVRPALGHGSHGEDPVEILANSLLSLDRQSRGAPFGVAVLEAPRLDAALAQLLDRLEGHQAVGATAIRDHLALLAELAEPRLELVDGNV